MKCKEHPYEPGIGVCPSCLRERLLALIAAQNELSATNNQHQHRRRRSDPAAAPVPPPLSFPRSVSPYVAHRRSVGSDASPARLRQHIHQRFFSTPQVGPTFEPAAGAGGGDFGNGGGRRGDAGRFSVLRMLFGRHRSEMQSDSGPSKGSGSSSWFSSLIPRRRKNKKSHHYPAPEEAPPAPPGWRSSWRASVKGMSPTMEDEVYGDSGYSTESPAGWRRPTPTPMRRFPGNHHGSFGGVSGFAVCLSPLVRSGTNGRRGQSAAAAAAEAGVSGELASQYRHASVGGASLWPNRSRKLADFGRFK